jgi:hypothetical protein
VPAGFHDYMVIFGFHDECVANLDSKLTPYTLRYGDLIFACHFHRFTQFTSPPISSTTVVLKIFWKDVANINLATKLDCTQQVEVQIPSPLQRKFISNQAALDPAAFSFLYYVKVPIIRKYFSIICDGSCSYYAVTHGNVLFFLS